MREARGLNPLLSPASEAIPDCQGPKTGAPSAGLEHLLGGSGSRLHSPFTMPYRGVNACAGEFFCFGYPTPPTVPQSQKQSTLYDFVFRPFLYNTIYLELLPREDFGGDLGRLRHVSRPVKPVNNAAKPRQLRVSCRFAAESVASNVGHCLPAHAATGGRCRPERSPGSNVWPGFEPHGVKAAMA